MDAQKRSIKDLFQDKRFLWTIPVLLILVGAFMYIASSSPSAPEKKTVEEPSAINTRVPAAKADSVVANRLDLQSESAGVNPQVASPMQGVPQSSSYMYTDRYNPTVGRTGGPLDSIYEPGRPARPSTKTSAALPDRLSRRNGGSRPSSSFPLSESDAVLDDDEPITSPEQAKQQAAQKAKLAVVVDKQARLEKLLAEYKQDKAERQARESDKTQALKVVTDEEGKIAVPITSLTGRDRTSRNAFFGLYTEDARKAQQRLLDEEVGTIRAMVYGDQEISPTGSRVKIRLLEPLYVRGIIIPQNTLLYGMGQFAGQRINLIIRSIQYQNRLFPVQIQVYDMDGMAGLYVPSMVNLDLAKQTAGQIAQSGGGGNSGGTVNLNGSAQAVAASAALQAGNQVVQGVRQGVARKAQAQRAYLKNNYYVLLRTVERNNGPEGGPASGVPLPVNAPVNERQLQLQMLQQILREQQ